MDATRPYLKHRYVSFTIEYDFKDVTSRNQEFFIKLKEQCYWNEISILRFQTKISRLNGK